MALYAIHYRTAGTFRINHMNLATSDGIAHALRGFLSSCRRGGRRPHREGDVWAYNWADGLKKNLLPYRCKFYTLLHSTDEEIAKFVEAEKQLLKENENV